MPTCCRSVAACARARWPVRKAGFRQLAKRHFHKSAEQRRGERSETTSELTSSAAVPPSTLPSRNRAHRSWCARAETGQGSLPGQTGSSSVITQRPAHPADDADTAQHRHHARNERRRQRLRAGRRNNQQDGRCRAQTQDRPSTRFNAPNVNEARHLTHGAAISRQRVSSRLLAALR